MLVFGYWLLIVSFVVGLYLNAGCSFVSVD